MNELAADSTAASTEQGDAKILGQPIGNYTISRFLAAGGMGAVYEAVHHTPGKRAAVKILSNVNAAGRFRDEAKILCALKHPGLVELYDWGRLADGTLYILMEYVDGVSLKDFRRSQGGVLPLAQTLELLRQLADALSTVHALGIVHRDLTPNNILVLPDKTARFGWRVKILDFGIAKLREGQEFRTQTGQCVGTPRYMAPEQCESASAVDSKADIYTLGLLACELLTGDSPYTVTTSTPVTWITAHIRQRPRPLRTFSKQIPVELSTFVAAMLDKMPEQRPTANQVLDFLSTGKPQRLAMPKNKKALVAGAFAGAGVLVGYLALSAWAPSKSNNEQDHKADIAVMEARTPPGMVFVQPTSFMMGSTSEEVERAYAYCLKTHPADDCSLETFQRELSAHRVTESPYYIDETEVTNEQYAAFLNTTTLRLDLGKTSGGVLRYVMLKPANQKEKLLVDLFFAKGRGSGLLRENGQYVVRSGFEKLPAVLITYEGARAYCQKHGGDLPTEAQWELAARPARSDETQSSSSLEEQKGLTCRQAVLGKVGSESCMPPTSAAPAPVGSHPEDRSFYGAFDMIGNISEWVRDSFQAPYPACDDCKDPVVHSPEGAEHVVRVYRGGSFNLSDVDARRHARSQRDEDTPSPDIGFRCAKSAVLTP